MNDCVAKSEKWEEILEKFNEQKNRNGGWDYIEIYDNLKEVFVRKCVK